MSHRQPQQRDGRNQIGERSARLQRGNVFSLAELMGELVNQCRRLSVSIDIERLSHYRVVAIQSRVEEVFGEMHPFALIVIEHECND